MTLVLWVHPCNKVEDALDRALAQVHKPGDEECCRGVLLMCDLGSATMVAQTVLEPEAIQRLYVHQCALLSKVQLLPRLLHGAEWDFAKLSAAAYQASSIWRGQSTQ